MKIKVINPNTTPEMTEDICVSARSGASPGTEVVCLNPAKGPGTVEGWYDEYISISFLIEELLKAERDDPADAYVVACFGDPGLYALRELTDKPVVGVAESAIALTRFVAARFAIVTIMPRIRLMLEELVERCGARHRCASIRTPDLSVADFMDDYDRCEKILIDQAREAIAEDYAEAIILGCAGMAAFVENVRKALPVPVFDAVASGVRVAESLVGLGIGTSKVQTYKPPEKKEFKGLGELFQP